MKTILHRSYACSTTSTPNRTPPPKHQHPPVPPHAWGSIINKHSFKDSCYSTQWSRPLFHAHTHTLSPTLLHICFYFFSVCEPPPSHTHKHTNTHSLISSLLPTVPAGKMSRNPTPPTHRASLLLSSLLLFPRSCSCWMSGIRCQDGVRTGCIGACERGCCCRLPELT